MRIVPALLILTATATLRADIVQLRAGSRHCETLAAADSLEGALRVQVVPPGADYAQIVREGFELLDDGDVAAAVKALQLAALRAPPDELPRLSELCQTLRGAPLDEVLAEARFRAALLAGKGRTLDIRYATPYESVALGRLLDDRQKRLLGTRYHGFTIEEWPRHRDEYDALRPDTRQTVADASMAAAVIGLRLKFDPRIKERGNERQRLLFLRADLARFAAKLLALKGYTTVETNDADDPGARELERLLAAQVNNREAATQPAGEDPDSTPDPQSRTP